MRLLPLAILVFIISCQSPDPATPMASMEVAPDTVFVEKPVQPILFPNGYEDISRFEESGIKGIEFLNPEGLKKTLGHEPVFVSDTIIELDMRDFPRLHILNKSKTQLATLYFYYGNRKNDVSLISIRALKQPRKYPQKPEALDVPQFVSSKGVHLEMSISQVQSILGEPSETGRHAMLYYVSYQQKGGLYFGNYYFENDELVSFEFGEEYP